MNLNQNEYEEDVAGGGEQQQPPLSQEAIAAAVEDALLKAIENANAQEPEFETQDEPEGDLPPQISMAEIAQYADSRDATVRALRKEYPELANLDDEQEETLRSMLRQAYPTKELMSAAASGKDPVAKLVAKSIAYEVLKKSSEAPPTTPTAFQIKEEQVAGIVGDRKVASEIARAMKEISEAVGYEVTYTPEQAKEVANGWRS
jgi:hypothetical protein